MGVSRAVLWGAFAVVAAAQLVEVREARACSPPWNGVSVRTVIPEAGATDVPLNARILVHYDGDAYSTLSLRAAGGETVSVTVDEVYDLGTARLLTPGVPLSPSTTYELLDTLVLPCDSEDTTQCVAEPTVVATFTTGTEEDTVAPVATGLTVGSSYWCNAGSGCEDSEDSVHNSVTFEQIVDDGPPAWIRYEYVDAVGVVGAGPTLVRNTGHGCGGNGAGYFPLVVYLGMPSTFRVRVVDLAGNTSETFTVVGATCEDYASSCVADGEPEETAPGDGGCSTGRGSGLVLALAALLLGSRRRRTIGA